MKKRRLYTALYLLGIFAFPVIFQPWHIIQHHGPGHECSTHAHHPDTDCLHESALPLENIKKSDHNHDPCYICDYEFPVKDLAAPFVLGFISHQFNILQSVNLVLTDLQRVYSLINPRAPPCSSPVLS